MGIRPATAAAAPVRGVPQYKYAAGVRNSQQHMIAQTQVSMQQVGNVGPDLPTRSGLHVGRGKVGIEVG